MWKLELDQDPQGRVVNRVGTKDDWYKKAAEYWNNTEATYNGVLGGYPELNDPDIKASFKFLSFLIEKGII